MWKDLGGYDQNIFSKKGFIKFMWVGKNILNRTATAQSTNPKCQQMELLKNKIFCPAKETISRASTVHIIEKNLFQLHFRQGANIHELQRNYI